MRVAGAHHAKSDDGGIGKRTSDAKTRLFGSTAWGLVTGLLLCGLGSPALAQSSVEESEEVIVTATKRAERLQDVPISITAFTSETLSAQGVQQPSDLHAPNFVFPEIYTTTRSYISSRGIFQEAPIIGFEGGFSQYMDGVYMGRNMAYATDLGEVERVEILRGPQGTLFGRNAIGGVMNIITKQPEDELGGSLSTEFGNWDLQRVRGHVNVPIVDDVLLSRVSFQRTIRDGYVDNVNINSPDSGGSNITSARAQLLFTPAPNFEIRGSLDYLNSKSNSYYAEISGSESTFPGAGDDLKYTFNGAIQPFDIKHDFGGSLTADYTFASGHTLTSITGARETTAHWILTDDVTRFGFQEQDLRDRQKIWSEEIRLTSPTGSFFDYVFGAYYYHEDAAFYGIVRRPIPTVANRFNVRSTTEDWAAFAHANFHFTDALTVRTGVRYTNEAKDAVGLILAGGAAGSQFIPPITGTPTYVRQIDAEETNWELGVEYHFTHDAMGYGRIATGFKGGGFNATDGVVVNPEHLISYELGAKTSWYDNRLVVNGAIFYSDYEDLQVRSRPATGPALIILQNAAGVHASGAELEIQASPIEQLSLNLAIGYVDSTFSDFRNARNFLGVFFDATGNQLPMTPEWTISGGIQYDQPLAGDSSLSYRLDFNYVSERYGVLDAGQNNARYALPGYTVFNARLGYRSPDDRWGVQVWGRNLTDEDAPTDRRPRQQAGIPGSPNATDTLQLVNYMQPRSYGVELSVDF